MTTTIDTNKTYTVKEVSEVLNISERRVRALIDHGRLHAEMRAGAYFIDGQEFERVAKTERRPGRPPRPPHTPMSEEERAKWHAEEERKRKESEQRQAAKDAEIKKYWDKFYADMGIDPKAQPESPWKGTRYEPTYGSCGYCKQVPCVCDGFGHDPKTGEELPY